MLSLSLEPDFTYMYLHEIWLAISLLWKLLKKKGVGNIRADRQEKIFFKKKCVNNPFGSQPVSREPFNTGAHNTPGHFHGTVVLVGDM